MNKLVKYSVTALLAAGLFGMSTQTTNAATNYQRLTHNAYAYNYNGQRANHKLYKKGSKVKVIGSITLNGKKYNIISGNIYIKASNFKHRRTNTVTLGDGYETSLLHNSYVYNAKGQRTRTKLHKGHSVTYYGGLVRINGKKYVQIGANQYIRSSNVLLAYDGPTGSDSINHTHPIKHNNSNASTSNNAANNSITNSSNSNNSSSKSDTNKKDYNKQTSSKSTDNKNISAKATNADYEALTDAIVKSQDADIMYASYSKRKALDDATNKGRQYLTFHSSFDKNDYSAQEIQTAITAINTAINNLDGNVERAKLPQIAVKNGVWDWTPDEIQQALNVANKIWGSKDAHIVKGIKGHSITKIVLTDTFGTIRSYPLNEYGKRIYAD